MELNRGDRVRFQIEKVKFIALPFPFLSHLKIMIMSRYSCAGRLRNVQKTVMHVQSSCFGH